MTTWEEIRDEIAGMLADGQPLEDVLTKLEQRKNEMAKANLIAVMDEMKKPKPMTNEEYIHSPNTEQFAEWLGDVVDEVCDTNNYNCKNCFKWCNRNKVVEWLKQPHQKE